MSEDLTHDSASSGKNGLRQGVQLSQPEFHVLYKAADSSYRAELLGGVVHEPSPVGWNHSESHSTLTGLFISYSARTAGVRVGDNGTVILSEIDEVQPDSILRITNGQSRIERGYVVGAPELVAEISNTSENFDLGLKKLRYTKAGVREYVVLCLEPARMYLFDLRAGQVLGEQDGILKSIEFPGLWFNVNAVLDNNHAAMLETLDVGLKSPEHKGFVEKLAEVIDN